jgi:hypothetical protein
MSDIEIIVNYTQHEVGIPFGEYSKVLAPGAKGEGGKPGAGVPSKTPDVLRIMPGINLPTVSGVVGQARRELKADEVGKVMAHPQVDRLVSRGVLGTFKRLAEIPTGSRIEIAKNSADVAALKAWEGRESDPKVKHAIAEQIKSIAETFGEAGDYRNVEQIPTYTGADATI